MPVPPSARHRLSRCPEGPRRQGMFPPSPAHPHPPNRPTRTPSPWRAYPPAGCWTQLTRRSSDWLSRQERVRPLGWVVHAALVCLVYLAHLGGFAIYGTVMGIDWLVGRLAACRRGEDLARV